MLSALFRSNVIETTDDLYFGINVFVNKDSFHERDDTVSYQDKTSYAQKLFIFQTGLFTQLFLLPKKSLLHFHLRTPFLVTIFSILHEKCPYLEFFWSVFSHIRTEYGEIDTLYLFVFGPNAGKYGP